MRTNYIHSCAVSPRPAIADLMELPGKASGRAVFLITRINVPEKARGLGYGSALLRQICEDANTEGVVLEVHPTPSGGLNMTQLLRWYRRYGFEGHAGVPMLRYPGAFVPRPRTEAERELPSCAGCGDWGAGAQLEPLRMGVPTEGLVIIGYCCHDCAERFRRLILARYPALVATWKSARAIDLVNRPSRTLGREDPP